MREQNRVTILSKLNEVQWSFTKQQGSLTPKALIDHFNLWHWEFFFEREAKTNPFKLTTALKEAYIKREKDVSFLSWEKIYFERD